MDALKSKGQMYDQIDLGKIPHSGFDLSYNCQGTGSLGRLYPVRCMETLPGDKFQGSSQIAVQFQPLAVPMLASMHMRSETFYVPNRLLWQDFEKFISGGQKLDDTSVIPTITPKQLYSQFLTPLLNTFFSRDDEQGIDEWLDSEDTVVLNFELGVFSTAPTTVLPSYDYMVPVSGSETKVRLFRSCLCYNVDTIALRLQVLYDKYVTIAKNANVYDLYLDSLSAIQSLIVYLQGLHGTLYANGTLLNGSDSLTIAVSGGNYMPIFDVQECFSSELVIGRSLSSTGDRFLDDILPILAEMKIFEDGNAPLYRFSEYMSSCVQYIYDFMRPFIGLGSNLDMLGYGCFHMSDLYAFVYYKYYSYTSASTTPYFKFNTPDFFMLEPSFLDKVSTLPMSVLPLRALYAIWYNYYRDQVLEADVMEPEVTDEILDEELLQLLVPRRRCWAKDTFTTALDNTGTGSVVVPVSDNVIKTAVSKRIAGFDTFVQDTADGSTAKLEEMDLVKYTLTTGETVSIPSHFLSGGVTSQGSGNLSGSAFSLDIMKRAQRVQKWIQKALIYGNRPQDFLFTHFAVRSSDARLQIPEYICGDSQLCRLDVITNNTTVGDTVAGDKAANAYGYTDGQGMNNFCEEHGYIITLFSIMPETSYGYGVERHLRRLDKFDFAFPEFADLGMDGVMDYELVNSHMDFRNISGLPYSQPVSNKVFGYQGRYYDYKSKQNEIHGDLQDTEDMYTFARKFNPYDKDSMPKLNRYFVHCRPRLDMFVTDYPLADQFRFDIHHSQAVERCLPVPSQFL